MKGIILSFKNEENIGLILGADGKRYSFNFLNEWKSNDKIPETHDEVDFIENGNIATEIFLLKIKNYEEKKDTNIHVHVESSEKARAKSGAMTLLMYPLIFAMIIFCPLMPIAYITQDVLRYTKWNWAREEGFSWKKKILYYIIFCIVFYTIYIYTYVNRMYVAQLFLGLGSVMFYMAYTDIGMKEHKENRKAS